ncbi:MAG: hypothetical protein O2914_00240 [Bacteroidetes bacterium]|nr:hypothetical protein [Bacteroidota bacterium]MDA0937242.1 hypothetical protein [Bacteroidota bacterium]MDA1345379.1 hypothetical protein [Bacteroidota bacterium]
MKKQIIILFLLLFGFQTQAQGDQKVSLLFQDMTPLEIKLSYSNKELRKDTNDSTFIDTEMQYKYNGNWEVLPVSLRARGNFRRAECYFPPVKMKVKKSNAKNTLFEGNKSLKLVLPCKIESNNNDNILQEYMAYKLYEVISPYHFKTRRVKITFEEEKGKKIKEYSLEGFLIEDDDLVADRFEGQVLERFIHPLAMDAESSAQNAFFQFMIGNTDFSTAYQHNGKLLYIDKKIIPLPYDFDMSGLVDASYATVNTTLGITSVKDRKYRGFKRDDEVLNGVRSQFLTNKQKLMDIVAAMAGDFESEKEFKETQKYIESFYDILENDKDFQASIVSQVRTK